MRRLAPHLGGAPLSFGSNRFCTPKTAVGRPLSFSKIPNGPRCAHTTPLTETQPAFAADIDPPEPNPPESNDATGGWEKARNVLRAKFPSANTDGVLFCIYKLEQDPLLSLRDFRDEAKMHGLSVAGRSLHSAKVALGLQAPARRRSKAIDAELSPEDQTRAMTHWGRDASTHTPAQPRRDEFERREPAPRSSNANRPKDGEKDDTLEHQMIAFAQQLQNRASEHGTRLRSAMKDAIRILQDALDDTE